MPQVDVPVSKSQQRRKERLAVRLLLLQAGITGLAYEESGKPYLVDGPYISISHSRDWVCVALHDSRPIGIDLECFSDRMLALAQRFMNEEEYLTEERVAEVEELENPTLGDICDILGTPAYMVAEEDPLKGYVFYGIEMNRTFFNEKVDLSLATVHQYAVEKGKVIPALIVFTDKENKVITIIYYENVAEDKDLDIDFDFGF